MRGRSLIRLGAVVLFGWGAWFAVVTAVQFVFHPPLIQIAIPAISIAFVILSGVLIWDRDRRTHGREQIRTVADRSIATTTLVGGVALILSGLAFGFWLVLIGAGVSALGLGGLAREQRARRRSQQEAWKRGATREGAQRR